MTSAQSALVRASDGATATPSCASAAAPRSARESGSDPHRPASACHAPTAPGTVIAPTPRGGMGPGGSAARPLPLTAWASPSCTSAITSPPTAFMCG